MIPRPLVRARTYRGEVRPSYVDVADEELLDLAERLRALYLSHDGGSRGALEDAVAEELELIADIKLGRGMARLLEDRSTFATPEDVDPPAVRREVFGVAAELWKAGEFDRDAALKVAAERLGMEASRVETDLYADLKSEQRLVEVRDLSAERLLQRYNVGLAQAVLLDAQKMVVRVEDGAARLRQLMGALKFHRLLFVSDTQEDRLELTIDGPMSLFGPTKKYGLQLANFLPSVLLCAKYEVEAEIVPKGKRRKRVLRITEETGLVSHVRDRSWVPEEVRAFPERFATLETDWTVREAEALFALEGGGVAVPDLRFDPPDGGEPVWLEQLGHWRKSSAQRHLRALASDGPARYIVAVSTGLCLEETVPELRHKRVPVLEFKNVLLPKKTLRLVEEVARG